MWSVIPVHVTDWWVYVVSSLKINNSFSFTRLSCAKLTNFDSQIAFSQIQHFKKQGAPFVSLTLRTITDAHP